MPPSASRSTAPGWCCASTFKAPAWAGWRSPGNTFDRRAYQVTAPDQATLPEIAELSPIVPPRTFRASLSPGHIRHLPLERRYDLAVPWPSDPGVVAITLAAAGDQRRCGGTQAREPTRSGGRRRAAGHRQRVRRGGTGSAGGGGLGPDAGRRRGDAGARGIHHGPGQRAQGTQGQSDQHHGQLPLEAGPGRRIGRRSPGVHLRLRCRGERRQHLDPAQVSRLLGEGLRRLARGRLQAWPRVGPGGRRVRWPRPCRPGSSRPRPIRPGSRSSARAWTRPSGPSPATLSRSA